MTLELAPEAETILREFAAKEGATPSEYISRLLPTVGMPYHAPRLRVLTREEAIALNAPTIARLERELAEAANATPKEIAEAQTEWEAFKKAMNDNRRENGERLVYAEPDATRVRNAGAATAPPHALDGDVILAGQVVEQGLDPADYIVVTDNVGHLARFVRAETWQNIVL